MATDRPTLDDLRFRAALERLRTARARAAVGPQCRDCGRADCPALAAATGETAGTMAAEFYRAVLECTRAQLYAAKREIVRLRALAREEGQP